MDIKISKNTCIVFDLDDTIYNEINYLKSSFGAIAKELDKDNWVNLYVRIFSMYRGKKDVFTFLEQKYAIPKEKLIQAYREHRPLLSPNIGAINLMKSIKQKDGKIGIITDGRKKTQHNKIQSLGISQFVDEIIISEETGFEKPHPKNFQLLAKKIATDVYYYIADNIKKDFIAPKKLGWNTIGVVDNGLNIHNNAYENDITRFPDQFIFSLRDIKIV